jgi:ATP-dependent helicase/nuclease subunit A
MMEFNKEKLKQAEKLQLEASNPIYSSWVSASAGSGKTRVLINRITRLLLTGVKPSQILCITYTKAGASEIKKRINEKLMEWAILSENDPKLHEDLQKLTQTTPSIKTIAKAKTLFTEILDDAEGLKIMTIHSFCQNIIKKFPIEAGIFPNFEVVEDEPAKEILIETRDELLSSKTHSPQVSEAIKTLAIKLNEDDFTKALSEFLDKRDKFLYLLEYKFQNLQNFIDDVYKTCGATKSNNQNTNLENFVKDESFDKSGIETLAQILSLGTGITDIKNAKVLSTWLKNTNTRKKTFNISNGYKSIFITGKNEAKQVGSVITKKLLETNPDLENIILSEQERILAFLEKQNSLEIAKLTEATLIVGNEILNIYARKKSEKGLLDYNDLIIKTNKLLSDENSATRDWILYKLDSNIDHILIDEAQDTSRYQWKMVDALKSEFFSGEGQKEGINRTIFVVGDEKQSIFSFQGAEPEIFNQQYKLYNNEAKNAGKIFKKVPLHYSFRSTPAILNFVDKVFSNESERKAINFSDEEIKHEAIRNSLIGHIELWPVIRNSEEKKAKTNAWEIDFEQEKTIKNEEKLAKVIAYKIKEWIENKRLIATQNGKEKQVKFGDIMILAHRRNNLKPIVKALQKAEIPVSGMDKISLNKEIAIWDLIALTKFISLPEDNLNLANILKSPLLGLTENDIFELCKNKNANINKDETLWKILSENEKYSETYKYLNALINKAKTQTPYELFYEILNTKNGRIKFAKRFGHHINETLDDFLSILLDYQEKQILTFEEVINLLEKSDQELKRDVKQKTNEVKLGTVHSSKGLEFPIVILADTCHGTKQIFPGKNKLIYNKNSILWNGSGLIHQNIKNAKEEDKQQLYNEYLRLLYVATTRAENELYICGHENKKSSEQTPHSSWYALMHKAMEKITGENNPQIKKIEFDFSEILNEEHKNNGFIFGKEYSYSANQKIEQSSSSTHSEGGVRDEGKTSNTNFEHLKNLFETIPPKELEDRVLHPSEFEKYKKGDKTPTFVSKNILRGTIIHKLLEILPETKLENREGIIEYYTKNFTNEFSTKEIESIKTKISEILKQESFKEFFSQNSKSEVPIIGKINGQVVSGQIDRLIISDNEIIIIDYKTSDFVPKSHTETPENYIKQIKLYKELIKKIYSDRIVKAFLLWTSDCSIIEV